jgi:hypothetical protein
VALTLILHFHVILLDSQQAGKWKKLLGLHGVQYRGNLSNVARFIKRYEICRTFERMQSANTTEVGPVLYRKEGIVALP